MARKKSKATRILEVLAELQREVNIYMEAFGGEETVDGFCDEINKSIIKVRGIIGDEI